MEIASTQGWKTKKTYNNCISPLRSAFDFGYKDLPGKTSPATGLECLRLTTRTCMGIAGTRQIASLKPSAPRRRQMARRTINQVDRWHVKRRVSAPPPYFTIAQADPFSDFVVGSNEPGVTSELQCLHLTAAARISSAQ